MLVAAANKADVLARLAVCECDWAWLCAGKATGDRPTEVTTEVTVSDGGDDPRMVL